MPFRFVDLDLRPSGYKDFISRERTPKLVEQFLMCLAVLLTGVAIVLLMNNEPELVALLFVVVGLAAVYVTSQTNRNRDLLQATELQNALFASALARGCAFCLIARQQDGEIVYHSPGFSDLFPEARRVGDWLAAAKAPPEAAARITDDIGLGREEEVPLAVEARGARPLPLLISVESIRRPAGFMLLRALEKPPGAA